MNTWGAHAVHAASLYSFALGASVTLLAFAVMKSPRPLNVRWRPADLRQQITRLGQVLAGVRRTSRSRFRQRLDLLLVQMLGDDADEQPQSRPSEEESWSAERTAADAPQTRRAEPSSSANPASSANSARSADPPKGYRSKHRLSEPRNDSHDAKPAPRHAAPPREPLLPPN